MESEMKHSCFVATWQSGGLLLTAILRNDAYVIVRSSRALETPASPSKAASGDFFGNERRTDTTRGAPGPTISAVAPKQSANGDDRSKQRGLNRPRHDECGLRVTMP